MTAHTSSVRPHADRRRPRRRRSDVRHDFRDGDQAATHPYSARRPRIDIGADDANRAAAGRWRLGQLRGLIAASLLPLDRYAKSEMATDGPAWRRLTV